MRRVTRMLLAACAIAVVCAIVLLYMILSDGGAIGAPADFAVAAVGAAPIAAVDVVQPAPEAVCAADAAVPREFTTQMAYTIGMPASAAEHGHSPPLDTPLPAFQEPKPRPPFVALTFDDGPSTQTIEILDILDYYGARATFCVLGRSISGRESTLVRMVDMGHEIVGHSWNHTSFATLDTADVHAQVRNTTAAITAATGISPPRLVRAPYGALNNTAINAVASLGYSLLGWSLDPQDWLNRNPQTIWEFVSARATDGAIVLLHDIHDTTVEATRIIVPYLIERGFSFVTVSEVIDLFYPNLRPGQVVRGLR